MNPSYHTDLEFNELLTLISTYYYKTFEVEKVETSLYIRPLRVGDLTYNLFQLTSTQLKEDLTRKGWVIVNVDEEGTIEVRSQRVQDLVDLIERGNVLIVNSNDQVEEYQQLLLANSFDDLSNKWHKLTGGEILDYREDEEYTNVNAQRDPDFHTDTNEFTL